MEDGPAGSKYNNFIAEIIKKILHVILAAETSSVLLLQE